MAVNHVCPTHGHSSHHVLAPTLQASTTAHDATEYTVQDITPDEVRWSIRKCKRKKATGPDRLTNDFYRNLEEDLVPLLTTVLNACLHSGHIPPSFLQASIFPLKKVVAPFTGLDFRPLAMLNTDYKVFTRILAKRTRPQLKPLIHPDSYQGEAYTLPSADSHKPNKQPRVTQRTSTHAAFK
ncbi:TPA: hypothetical protein N0F65_001021 [Lagenidium giganteum]|uniref:Reverse transcriptase n=1 Tax=Lagenidium giganteum TaxID=4803 RepID=A0AAV2YU93_9STRA|nr:TPA: hypothetical protein N0F65_001021 [Lagenidium giganteum]